ncbi:MAG: hypothetical protein ACKVHH_03640 [Candidatus Poseidoniales archaeon]
MPSDLLAKAVLHRREQLLQSLPEQISQLKSELGGTSPVASETGKKRDDVNAKVATLKLERNKYKAEAFDLIRRSKELRELLISEGRLKNPDPKWAKDKLVEQIALMEQDFETKAGDHKSERKFLRTIRELTSKHQEEVKARIASNPELGELNEMQSKIKPLFEAAEKAHDAMGELVGESDELHTSWTSVVEEQRILHARLFRAESAFENSVKATEYWEKRLKDGFGDLGVAGFQDLYAAANNIKEGGMSSIAVRRNVKLQREAKEPPKKTKEGEEE